MHRFILIYFNDNVSVLSYLCLYIRRFMTLVAITVFHAKDAALFANRVKVYLLKLSFGTSAQANMDNHVSIALWEMGHLISRLMGEG